MARSSFCETLEARRFLSASTLTQDEAALATAITQYQSDKTSAAAALATDHAKIKADGKIVDPKLAALRATLKEDELSTKNTVLTDRTNRQLAADTDKIAILKDRQNIKTDRANKDKTQFAVDKAQRSQDELKLQTDRTTLGIIVQNAIIARAATLNADRQAIVTEIATNGGNPARAMDKQTLTNDQLMWTVTLAGDRKTILTDRLVVSTDKHG